MTEIEKDAARYALLCARLVGEGSYANGMSAGLKEAGGSRKARRAYSDMASRLGDVLREAQRAYKQIHDDAP